jgi:MFS transporter, FHS family, glucose/mannose:H+ symporter
MLTHLLTHGERMRPSSRSSLAPSFVLIVGALLFTAIGWSNAAFGPTLPELAQKSGASLTSIGGLVSAFYFGSVASQLAAGRLSDRIGQRPLVAAGMLTLSGGALGLALSPTPVSLFAAAFIAGLGFGTLLVVTNLLVAAAFPEHRRAAALNFVAVFGGVGSFCSPALAAASLAEFKTAIPVFWVSALISALALPVVGRLPSFQVAPAEAISGLTRPVYRDPLVLSVGLLLFLCVGVENSIGALTPTYLSRTTSASEANATYLTSGYWLALALGRFLAALLGRRMPDISLLRLCLAGSAGFGLLLSLSVGHLVLSTIAMLGLGLCIGPLYPTTIAVTTRGARHAPGAAIGLVSTLSHCGAGVLPLVTVALFDKVSPAASVILIAGVTAATLILQIAISMASRARLTDELRAA